MGHDSKVNGIWQSTSNYYSAIYRIDGDEVNVLFYDDGTSRFSSSKGKLHHWTNLLNVDASSGATSKGDSVQTGLELIHPDTLKVSYKVYTKVKTELLVKLDSYEKTTD